MVVGCGNAHDAASHTQGRKSLKTMRDSKKDFRHRFLFYADENENTRIPDSWGHTHHRAKGTKPWGCPEGHTGPNTRATPAPPTPPPQPATPVPPSKEGGRRDRRSKNILESMRPAGSPLPAPQLPVGLATGLARKSTAPPINPQRLKSQGPPSTSQRSPSRRLRVKQIFYSISVIYTIKLY